MIEGTINGIPKLSDFQYYAATNYWIQTNDSVERIIEIRMR